MKERPLIGKGKRGTLAVIKFPMFVFKFYSRVTRGKTLGSRVAVFDERGHVLLVKASYVSGWNLPGGGVDPGETLRGAALRELREEASVEPLDRLQLHGIFSNEKSFSGDHVAVYVCRKFRQGEFTANIEITAAQFFPTDGLPTDLNPGARQRIKEIISGGGQLPDDWNA
jgi:ADP-ribose pyrophosphatase YjhB (NUDIX family)